MTALDDRPPAIVATDRCHCSHTRAAHVGRAVLLRDDPGERRNARIVDGLVVTEVVEVDPVGRLWRSWPDACALMLCRCEIYRGEADR